MAMLQIILDLTIYTSTRPAPLDWGPRWNTCNNFENQVIVAILFYGADSFYFIYLLHPTILDFAVIELPSVSAREHSFK